MNLVINARSGVGSFAQGGIYREYVILTSDVDIVAGNTIRISPALFDATFQADQVLPKKYHWKLVYTTTGEFSMTPVSFVIDKYKNVLVKINFFSARIFEVRFEWIAIADTGKYLNPYPYQPLTLWQNQAVDKINKDNVYNSADKLLGLRITIDVADTDPPENRAFVQSDYPVQGIPWTVANYPSIDNKFYYEADGSPVNGFVFGSDLKVKLRNFPRYTNTQYVAGIYRTDQEAFVNGAFYDEMYMQMARANNTADEPFLLSSSLIDRNQLKDMRVFRYEHSESFAEFTIDADYFTQGGRYRVFVCTIEECIYKSYLFDEFGEKTTWPQPKGDIEVLEINVDGIAIDLDYGKCLVNVPTGAEIELVVKMDIDSYNIDLGTKGIAGVFEDYFKDIECYISNGVNQLGIPVPDQVASYSNTTTESTITYSFKVPKDWVGLQKYINFAWIFDYKNGEVDHITGFTGLHIVNKPDYINLKTPDPLPESYCDIDAVATEFCFEASEASNEHKLFIDLINENQTIPAEDVIEQTELDFGTDNDACIELDYTLINVNQEYCIDLRAWKASRDTDEFPCLEFQFEAERVANGYDIEYILRFDIPAWTDSDVNSIDVLISDAIRGNFVIIQSSNSKTGDITINEQTYVNSPWLIQVSIIRTDGSTGYFEFYFTAQEGGNTMTVDTCSVDVPTQDCAENPTLSASIVWNYAGAGQLTSKTITPVESGFGAAAVTRYKILNGVESAYTVPFTVGAFINVALRYELDYGGGCTMELYYCIKEQRSSAP